MQKSILAIDQGTTGTTALLINCETWELEAKVNQEFPQIYPRPGLVEHDLNNIWQTVEQTVTKLLQENPREIVSIGITNQRETTCAFNRQGEPLANAIVWQDRRTSSRCEELKEKENHFKQKTGLTLDPYFSATKMEWLINSGIDQSDLHFGTIDTFLLYKLTGSFATETSNASRTLLMDLQTQKWDQELCHTFGIKEKWLPEIKDSFTEFGRTKGLSFLPDGIPVTGILGDQQAALFGQAGLDQGDMKCTYGTGAFLLVNTGENLQYSKSGLLTTIAYRHQGKAFYALEGSSFIAGAAVQWLRDNLKIIPNSPAIESLAQEVKDLKQMEHLLFLPFFSGLGSPHWKPEGKAAIVGLTRDTANPHIARACLEGVCLSIDDLIKAVEADLGKSLSQLKVDGGACANNFWMQLQSNFSDLDIIRPKVIETTAYGAALGAAVGAGLISLADIKKLWKVEKTFSSESSDYHSLKKDQWKETIESFY